ncbi:asparagine synthase (glutamine-hydrolyzing) [Roseburia sp. 499]|uniref:asparagine synthase (glutamine-hydrolyzing) n=1 Tax=Roseburia sp. 499 TaxID=1261634 RepID=UPI0009525880|nr:asparagine synthase (glutamine-hydrolyzing) [Roseburia sp. 499]WVK69295.1 asparagine synthase (glutamine-hydrolyzing) [Roseburia sp. 499]
MCGICGYISKHEYPIKILKKMNDTMVHRGPNDSGEIIERMSDGAYIGLGQRRLSIIDLSENGHQPMYGTNKDVVIAYNGEIYNFMDIREELEKNGRKFISKCDTEVLLQAYEEYGISMLDKLNGMFAFSLYDKKNNLVILARDRIGEKPLYYYWNGKTMIWGSELKPIMTHPDFHKEVRRDIISKYLCHKFICSPDTIFEDTYKLEPGQYIIYHDGKIEKRKYWDIIEKYEENSTNLIEDYFEVRKGVKELIYDSVKLRMNADVPVGTFLSGGIDSTLITAMAQEIKGSKIRTYTIGFETKEENEAIYAKEIAKHIGTDHTELYITQKDLIDMLEEMPKYFDEPFADSSQIPTMLVSKLARQDVTVTLAGDGGDELFCGYKMYDWAHWAQKLDVFGNIAYHMCGEKMINMMPDKLYALVKNRDAKYKAQLFTDVRQRYTRNIVEGISESAKYNFEEKMTESDWQIRRMLIDMKTYLPDEILCKTDRASMKYSLEARVPLVDYRLVEYSFRIPHEFKYKSGCKKYILKDITYDYVPKELLDRPKQGFGVPLALWMRTILYEDLCRYAEPEKLEKQGIFRSEEIWKFINMVSKSNKSVYNSVLWSFYVFQKWYQEYVEDLWN